MVPNTYTHPSPKPFHPCTQTLSYTHPHTPFTHGPRHRHPPLPLLPMDDNNLIVVVRSGSIVVVHGGSIVVVRGGSIVVVRGGSWWFVVVRSGS